MSTKEFTPEKISSLAENEIFVFGSNLLGQHVGGAARYAFDHFGAVWGIGVGPQGQCYAIPTMHGGVENILPYVDQFVDYAAKNPQLKFLVTPVGCGIAGFSVSDIAPLFHGTLHLENVVLPKTFVDFLTGSNAVTETREQRAQRLVDVFKDTQLMIRENPSLNRTVENSKSRTHFYGVSDIPAVDKNRGKEMKIVVTGNRSFQGARQLAERNPGKRVAVLNFASATSPGGGVERGSSAQEESLCRCSTLYPVLKQQTLWNQFYSFHRERRNRLYTDACIYTPEVKVIKSDENHPERLPEDQWLTVDVITCAAPNLRFDTVLPDEDLVELHLSRGRKILDVAIANGADCLVLGAFGCGAFRNDPKVVAAVYAQLMKEYRNAFDEVEFAVFYCGSEITNYEAFKTVFEKF